MNLNVEEVLKSDDRYLCLPFEFGFKRGILQDKDGTLSVVYVHRKKVYSSLGKILKWLRKHKAASALVGCFSFDHAINIQQRLMFNVDQEKIVLEDFSNGVERFPILAVCCKDVYPLPEPPRIVYINDIVISNELKHNQLDLHPDEAFLECCNCKDDCLDKMKCACFLKTLNNCSEENRKWIGDKFIGYNYCRLDYQILSGIFECHDGCNCKKNACVNRVTQNGILFPLELAYYGKKGWGVRTTGDIPSGAFICMYFGEVINEDVASAYEKKYGKQRCWYFADMKIGESEKPGYEDCVVPDETEMNEQESLQSQNFGSPVNYDCAIKEVYDDKKEKEEEEEEENEEEVMTQQTSLHGTQKTSETLSSNDTMTSSSQSCSQSQPSSVDESPHCQPLLLHDVLLDGYQVGNIGGFLNHSCMPNAFAQFVFWDNHDLRLPRIALFARENISAGQELTWDYGYKSSDEDADAGNVKSISCLCGAENCRGPIF